MNRARTPAIAEHGANEGSVGQIALDQRSPPHRLVVAGAEVVQDHRLDAGGGQRLGRLAADVPGAAGDQDAHAASRLLSTCREAAIVRCSPSRTGTRGSQPSARLAREMSGRRCRGSSLGRGAKTIGERAPVRSLLPDEVVKSIEGKSVVQLARDGYSRPMVAADFVEELLIRACYSPSGTAVTKETGSPFGGIIDLDNWGRESLVVEATK